MSYLYHNGSHATEAKDFLPAQFEHAENIKKLIDAVMEQIQELEDVFAAMFDYEQLDNAFGATLDKIGAIAGESRNGNSDAVYRTRIRAKTIFNRSSGQGNLIIDMLKTQTGVSTVFLEEMAGIIYVTVFTSIVPDTSFTLLINKMVAAGIMVILTYIESAGVPFVLKDANGSDPAFGGGLSDYYGTPDGYLVSIV